MTHKHRRYVIETNGDDDAGGFVPDGRWVLQGRFWVAAAVSLVIAGASFVFWMSNTFASKADVGQVVDMLRRHEANPAVSLDEYRRHESLPAHPATMILATDVKVALETIKTDLAYLRKEVQELEEAQNRKAKPPK